MAVDREGLWNAALEQVQHMLSCKSRNQNVITFYAQEGQNMGKLGKVRKSREKKEIELRFESKILNQKLTIKFFFKHFVLFGIFQNFEIF